MKVISTKQINQQINDVVIIKESGRGSFWLIIGLLLAGTSYPKIKSLLGVSDKEVQEAVEIYHKEHGVDLFHHLQEDNIEEESPEIAYQHRTHMQGKTHSFQYGNFLRDLMNFEGFSEVSYYDNGRWSIGYGTLAEGPGEHITREQALRRLSQEAKIAIDGAKRLLQHRAENGQLLDIISQMVYQMGTNGVSKFRNMWKAIEKEDYVLASKEMLDSVWAKQTPKRAQYLSKRMAALD